MTAPSDSGDRASAARRVRQTHKTRRSVKVADGVARGLITVGGAGTIAAVLAVALFLIWVVKDLFLPAEIGQRRELTPLEVPPLAIGCDEYRTTLWTVLDDGRLVTRRMDTGERLAAVELLQAATAGAQRTAWSRTTDGEGLIVGYSDGSIRIVRLAFVTTYHEIDDVEPELRRLDVGAFAPWRNGVVQLTNRGQFRLQELTTEARDPMQVSDGPIVSVTLVDSPSGPVAAALDASGSVAIVRGEVRTNFMTGEEELAWDEPSRFELDGADGRELPRFVQLYDRGASLVTAWSDGRLARYSIRNPADVRLAETVELLDDGDDRELTALGLLLGDSTLLVGDSSGVVRGWFLVPDAANAVDATSLALGHELRLPDEPDGTAIRSITSSSRERIFAVGTERGTAHAFFMTSQKHLGRVESDTGEPLRAIAIAPKDDGILAADRSGLMTWTFDTRHPEVSLRSLFGRVWYERYEAPTFAWQSSSGSDDFEPKLSLTPLIFGTIKATFYSMLFAVPLALLAAVYTSEFMSRRARARIKPTIELMASLPSVVLGFLAASVIAPFVEQVVPTVLNTFVTVPLCLLVFAFLWQLNSPTRIARLEPLRLGLNFVAIVLGLIAAWLLGGVTESLVFAGNLNLWLDGQIGHGATSWFVAFVPLSALAIAVVTIQRVNPWLRNRYGDRTERGLAIVHLVKFAIGVPTFLAVAGLLGLAAYYLPVPFGGEGLDLRDGVSVAGVDISPFSTFDQRNALIVGFVMGFAVIPIIYTIAEDALTSVPNHLRAASLGAGATPWQTAMRIVVPTAMSGLFSAIMIGLGRAVGETMIVLMATGNTAIMEMNAFNGFRTLSANIATELPEAVEGSTHYRTLFLAALTLFVLTFVINTVAEAVRIRFRRRAYQL